MEIDKKNAMVQYGVWTNCCNNCDFCLRLNRTPYTKEQQLFWIDRIKRNIEHIDWTNSFHYGISLLGGELFYVTDKELQNALYELIDVVIEKVLLVEPTKNKKFSTVTNGIYNPDFLFSICDHIVERVGTTDVLDVNFSYDLKYRYKNEEDRKTTLRNINLFHQRYNYQLGVQMILTQHVIDLVKRGEFDVNEFINKEIPGNTLCFLYPHPIHTGKVLDDFFFKREDLLWFLMYLKNNSYFVYQSFINSTKNSGVFKYTGFRHRQGFENDFAQQPILSDGKEVLNEKCGHSILYKCYSNSDKCILCDILNYDGELQ